MINAELIIGLCDRWHQLPSAILEEDASVMQLLSLADSGKEEYSDGE